MTSGMRLAYVLKDARRVTAATRLRDDEHHWFNDVSEGLLISTPGLP